jgi:N-acetylmuramoyl-L-alanine amidase
MNFSFLCRVASVLAFATLTVGSYAVTAKICIDPGHGGSDPGAVGGGQTEANNVKNTGIKFKSWLDKDTADGAGGGSWTIVITRTTDVFVSLQGRCDISNNNGCNRFMSIHNNAFNKSVHGTETFSLSGTGTAADLRNKVQARMIQAWNRTNRGNKTYNFHVLRNTNAPAELAELGFVDAPIDQPYTGSASWQDVAAKYQMFALQDHYGIAAYTPTTPGGGTTYIVDNGSAGFSASANWSTGSSSTDKHGADYRFRPTEAISDAASFTANVSAAGSYTVYAWWAAGTNRSTSAGYILPGGANPHVNQTTGGGQWNSLGTATLVAGNNTTQLSCWSATGAVVIADAVRYVKN